MTNLQEAKLAREAEICYATVAMVTDYDCWREGHDAVTIEEIVAVLHKNADNAAKVVKAAVAAMPKERTCACATAAKYAMLTQPDAIPAAAKERAGAAVWEVFGAGSECELAERRCWRSRVSRHNCCRCDQRLE